MIDVVDGLNMVLKKFELDDESREDIEDAIKRLKYERLRGEKLQERLSSIEEILEDTRDSITSVFERADEHISKIEDSENWALWLF